MDTEKYLKAKEELLTAQEGGCQQFFIENNCLLELGYYFLFHKNIDDAVRYFEILEEFEPRARWGKFLAKLSVDKIEGYPTYFELRNFLEIDLDIMLKYYLGDYVENIVQYSDWMSNINPEVQKFIGRVFFKNGYDDWGYFYFKKARDTFFNDPELHYLFAEYFYSKNDLVNVELSLENCLTILPEYYPAIRMKTVISDKHI